MSGSNPSKLAGPLQKRVAVDGQAWSQARNEPTDEIGLYIEAEPGALDAVRRAVEGMGIDVASEIGAYLIADVPAQNILDLPGVDSVRHVAERREFEEHYVSSEYISEGVGIVNADTLHAEGITGQGARIAVIDHTFHVDNPKYKDRIVAMEGPSSAFTRNSDYTGGKQHGTACAEILSDVARDAELVLASVLDQNQSFSSLMDDVESHNPDAATMSLGFYTGLRIDGRDPISTRVDSFTDGGRLFASSAGNEADGGHWDGQFQDDGSGLMVFDQSLSTPTRFPLLMAPNSSSAEIHVHWDADWSTDNQRYEARLYDTETGTTPIDTSQTTDPVEVLTLTPTEHSGNADNRYYVEIENVGATGSEHFDMFHWGAALFDVLSTAPRSVGIPATNPDENTLAVAAVQATDTGIETNAGNLKGYSSRGPTQDGRRGVDVAAPSRISQTKVGDYGAYGTLDNYTSNSRTGFNGTSAASPHIGGVFGLLWDSDVTATRDERRQAIFDNATGIPDSSVSSPGSNNTKIGFGYANAKASYDQLDPVSLALGDDSISKGGQASLAITAEEVDSVTIEDLWTGWSYNEGDSSLDGGSVTDNIRSNGKLTLTWGSVQGSTSPTVALDIPPRYIGGVYGLDGSATGPEGSASDTATLTIS